MQSGYWILYHCNNTKAGVVIALFLLGYTHGNIAEGERQQIYRGRTWLTCKYSNIDVLLQEMTTPNKLHAYLE
jgi:hypothetical protein